MLKRQAQWVPVLTHNPAFRDSFPRFLDRNPITALSVSAMDVKLENAMVAVEPDARQPDKLVAAMMAFPARVTAEACNNASLFPTSHPALAGGKSKGKLSFGLATAVCDSFNSFHLMERLLPHFNAHVSVNIQCQLLRSLWEGDEVIIVSTIDKLGKRLVYCKTELFIESPGFVPSAEMLKREKEMRTLHDLRQALSFYDLAVTGTHVKSILPEGKVKREISHD